MYTLATSAIRPRPAGIAVTVALIGLLCSPVRADDRFSLTAAVPDDVFICVGERHNPEKAFLAEYWREVFVALEEADVGSDVLDLIGSFLDDEQQEEFERIKDKVVRLFGGVDWGRLAGREFMFAERMSVPTRNGNSLSVGPPDMVWLFRGTGDAAKNHQGLVAILDGIAEEANKLAGKDVLTVDKTERKKVVLATVNLLGSVKNAPPLMLSTGQYRDIVFISLGEQMLDDVAGLLTGGGTKKAISATPRFKAAFAMLPEPEDMISYFDARQLVRGLNLIAETVIDTVGSKAGGRIINMGQSEEGNRLNAKAVAEYSEGDFEAALETIKQAHQVEAKDTRIMYNLACFHALNGHREEALTWLDRAVEGGFHDPDKIAGDDDLESLRDKPKYKAALAKATEAANKPPPWKGIATGIVRRILDVPGMFDYVATVGHTEGFSTFTEAIAVLVPDARDKPFYKVVADRRPIGDFAHFLPKETVAYHVGNGADLSALYQFIEDTIHEVGPPGDAKLARWKEIQDSAGFDVKKDLLAWIEGEGISATIDRDGTEETVWFVRVSDESAAKSRLNAGLDFLKDKLADLLPKNPMLAAFSVSTSPAKHERLEGFRNVFFSLSPKPLVCGVRDGYLMFGSSEEVIALCLATAGGDHPNVRSNSRVMAEALVPKGKAESVSLTDYRNVGNKIADGLNFVSVMGGMASMAIPEPEVRQAVMQVLGIVANIAPVARKVDFYKSTASYTTFDGKAWHTRHVTHYLSPKERPVDQGRPSTPAVAPGT